MQALKKPLFALVLLICLFSNFQVTANEPNMGRGKWLFLCSSHKNFSNTLWFWMLPFDHHHSQQLIITAFIGASNSFHIALSEGPHLCVPGLCWPSWNRPILLKALHSLDSSFISLLRLQPPFLFSPLLHLHIMELSRKCSAIYDLFLDQCFSSLTTLSIYL